MRLFIAALLFAISYAQTDLDTAVGSPSSLALAPKPNPFEEDFDDICDFKNEDEFVEKYPETKGKFANAFLCCKAVKKIEERHGLKAKGGFSKTCNGIVSFFNALNSRTLDRDQSITKKEFIRVATAPVMEAFSYSTREKARADIPFLFNLLDRDDNDVLNIDELADCPCVTGSLEMAITEGKSMDLVLEELEQCPPAQEMMEKSLTCDDEVNPKSNHICVYSDSSGARRANNLKTLLEKEKFYRDWEDICRFKTRKQFLKEYPEEQKNWADRYRCCETVRKIKESDTSTLQDGFAQTCDGIVSFFNFFRSKTIDKNGQVTKDEFIRIGTVAIKEAFHYETEADARDAIPGFFGLLDTNGDQSLDIVELFECPCVVGTLEMAITKGASMQLVNPYVLEMMEKSIGCDKTENPKSDGFCVESDKMGAIRMKTIKKLLHEEKFYRDFEDICRFKTRRQFLKAYPEEKGNWANRFMCCTTVGEIKEHETVPLQDGFAKTCKAIVSMFNSINAATKDKNGKITAAEFINVATRAVKKAFHYKSEKEARDDIPGFFGLLDTDKDESLDIDELFECPCVVGTLEMAITKGASMELVNPYVLDMMEKSIKCSKTNPASKGLCVRSDKMGETRMTTIKKLLDEEKAMKEEEKAVAMNKEFVAESSLLNSTGDYENTLLYIFAIVGVFSMLYHLHRACVKTDYSRMETANCEEI